VESKVSARCRVDAPWVPAWAHESLMRTVSRSAGHAIVKNQTKAVPFKPYYVKTSHSLLVSSSSTRSQAQNIDDSLSKVCKPCRPYHSHFERRFFLKMHAIVMDAAKTFITNEPSAEQRQRVANLEKAHNRRRRLEKDARSAVKKMRSSKGWSD
jgi:peptidyl-tRNA hydrolase ICT1